MKISHRFLLTALYAAFPLLVMAETYGIVSDGDDLLHTFHTQVYFEENLGQFSADILYQSNVFETQVRFLADGLSFAAIREIEHDETPSPGGSNKHSPKIGYLGEQEPDYEALVWQMEFVGMNEAAAPVGKTTIPGHLHYLKGNSAESWNTDVRRYQELWYEDIYPATDLRYYGTGEHELKYDFVLKPGFDLTNIRMRFTGIEGISINEAGELILYTPWGEVKDAAPYSYQQLFGKEKSVAISYRLIDEETVGFELTGAYDPTKSIVLDPLTLDWGTFFHTSTSDDYVMAVKRDAVGNIYYTGYTKSLAFPATAGVYQNSFSGSLDAYVAKLAPNGDSLIYATFLGGTDWELAYGLELNAANEAYISGFTASTDYPTTSGAYQQVSGGGLVESFLAKLSAAGDALEYSTYLGGSDRDYIYDMDLNAAGEAFVTGFTLSSNFPTSAGAYSSSLSTNGDVFVARVSADGSALVYSTLVGGSQFEIGQAITINANNEAFVTGNTASANFPTTAGALLTTLQTAAGSTQEDGFVFKLDQTGSTLNYSTYFGGTASDVIYDIDVNSIDEVFITGITYSADLPVTSGAYQETLSDTPPSLGDAFVARIAAAGNALTYSTYLGGTEIDFGKSIEVNAYNEAHILGATRSSDFPISGQVSGFAAMYDIFLTVLDADGAAVTNSTLLGGLYNEYPRAPGSLYLDNDKMTIAATTHSYDAEITSGVYQNTKTNGVSDAPWILNMEVATILPASFGDFEVKWEKRFQHSLLQWTSEREPANATYYIERKLGETTWETIGMMPGVQPLQAVHTYTFTDRDAAQFRNQSVFYRLRYAGNDGRVYFSQVEEIQIPGASQAEMNFYPNPARDQVELELYLPATVTGRLEIIDLIGQVVGTYRFEESQATRMPIRSMLDISHLPSGLYYMHLHTGNGAPMAKSLVIAR